MEEVTCLRFVAYDPNLHNDFVTVRGTGSGCSSSVGRRGTGEQFLNLAPSAALEIGCFRLYTIVHEFMHAIGFYHMQSATERDEYVEIVWDKIQAGTENNFAKHGFDTITNYGVEYGKKRDSSQRNPINLNNKLPRLRIDDALFENGILHRWKRHDCSIEGFEWRNYGAEIANE